VREGRGGGDWGYGIISRSAFSFIFPEISEIEDQNGKHKLDL